MASACYWVASQTDAVYASRMARVGSVGVYGVFRDYSKAFESAGIKSFLVKSGESKGAFAQGLPVTPEMLDAAQVRVDQIGAIFRATVTAARPRIKDADMQGQDFMGDAALESGFVDAIAGFSTALADAGTLARMRGVVG
jgi:ClpP class serine protease